MEEYHKISFIKNAIAYSGTNVISQIITLIKGFLVRRILPPEIMGFWNLVAVVQGFIGTFDLGCIAGANRELPIMKGRRDQEDEIKIHSTTLWFTLFQNITISIIALLYVWWNRANYASWEITAVFVAIIIFVIMSFQSAYMTFFSAAQAFVPLSKLLLVSSIIEGISFPLCAYMWGLSGIMVMAMISTCLTCGLFFLYGRLYKLYSYRRIFWNVLKRLLSFGFFLRLIDYPNALFSMANILWVTKLMNISDLALFSMARGFFFQVSDISTRVSTVYSMRFLEQGGSGIPRYVIARQLIQFLLFQLLVIVPLLYWGASVTLPFIIRNFIPKYSDANQAILILLICGFFYVLNSGLTNPWVFEKRLVARGIANVAGLIMMIIALAVPWFILGRRTINDVAYSTVAGYFLYFVYMVIAVGKDIWRPIECVEIILSVTIAAVWTFLLLHAGQASIGGHIGFAEDLKATLFMGGWTFLCLLPVTMYGLKRSQILKGWQQ